MHSTFASAVGCYPELVRWKSLCGEPLPRAFPRHCWQNQMRSIPCGGKALFRPGGITHLHVALMVDVCLSLGLQGVPQRAGGGGVDVAVAGRLEAGPWAIPALGLTSRRTSLHRMFCPARSECHRCPDSLAKRQKVCLEANVRLDMITCQVSVYARPPGSRPGHQSAAAGGLG